MGYRPEEQSLENPSDKIIEGIKEFTSAVEKRIESNNWQAEHIEEISEIDDELQKIKKKLLKIKNETW